VRVWTIGAGGLIGSAVDAASSERFRADPVPWSDPDGAVTSLATSLSRFVAETGSEPWAIVWAAGAATVSASDEQADREADVFRRFAEHISNSALPERGAFFLCSSAGGVHAGSAHPPFTDTTPPAPISPYGRARLAQEESAAALIGERWPVILGRLSNVYGPGQNLTKLQGLVSRLAVCSVTRVPLNLFVPLSTVRDYIYVTDAAAAVHAWLSEAHRDGTPGARVRIIASGQATSVGQLVRTAQDVGHRRVPIAMGSHPSAGRQAPDLRFIPSALPDSTTLPSTSLPVGMKSVFDDIRWRLQTAIA
jgi:UDP-glucose 4-epimerase